MSDLQADKGSAGYVFEFGTWRQVPVAAVRQGTTQGRPPKKKGG